MKMVFSMIFSTVVTMSLTGGFVIVLVLLMRLLLARAPKIFSYLLWGAVLLRLLCPVSFTSGLSVFQMMDIVGIEHGRVTRNDSQPQTSAARITDSITGGSQDQISAVYLAEDLSNVRAGQMPAFKTAQEETGINAAASQMIESMARFSVRGAGTASTAIWVLGVVFLWLYSAVSVLRLKRQLTGASPDEKSGAANIFLCDYIHTAFVMGVLRPRIYLPTTLTESERRYILLHEKTHIRRGDHILRLLAFLALSLHWFNPLVWCAFFLSEKDMEMSCDEAVMRQMGTDLRAAYSASLLNLASGKKVFAGAPLGFGEGSVKSRIKNIMRYKKTAVFVAVPVFVLVGIALVALGSNPAGADREDSEENLIEENLSGNDSFQDNAAEVQESAVSAESESGSERILISPAVVTDKMVCDIEGPVLDYADGETLIFHHDFGLFIYDMGSSRLDSSVNLKELGCLDEKEQLNCEIFVTEDGKRVYLHPYDTEELYQYDVAGRRVTREAYDSGYYREHNMDFFVPLKQTKNCVDPDYTVWRSEECVTLRGDEHGYLYLESGSGMVMDLYYVVEVGAGGGERVRFAKIFDDQKGTGGLFEYAAYTGYLDECTAWDGHEQFVDTDYDGDGRIDRVYRTDLISAEMCTYRIEFGNGDMLETKQLGMGMPQIRTCDLDGDGIKEILMQLSYGFHSDPNAYGETALFAKKNGSYEPLMPPEELCTYMEGTVPALQGGNDTYNPCITVVCKRLGEEFPEWASMPPQVWDEVQTPHIHVTVKELAKSAQISETVPLNQGMEYLFEEPDTTLEHRSVCYKTEIVKSGRQDLLEFYFEAVNKWSLDEIVVTAACENGALHVVGSRYVRESEQSEQPSKDKLYNVSPEEAAVIPAVEPLSFEEASKKGTVEEYDNETGGMLPGLGFGMWYLVRTDGVEYIYGKMDKDNFNKGYELYSWALWDDSHQLANGLKVGMTRDEALACCPRLMSIDFETTGLYSWNGTAYPDFWTEDFDEILIANIDDHIENMPVCLALMMKGDLVRAITKYELTAG
ncbi:MAG: M56 family metallopeptidase [Lachnospiraceae bacterium]|nr:M56 family metallopeptidase [Lachnospiraceae bacterium]